MIHVTRVTQTLRLSVARRESWKGSTDIMSLVQLLLWHHFIRIPPLCRAQKV